VRTSGAAGSGSGSGALTGPGASGKGRVTVISGGALGGWIGRGGPSAPEVRPRVGNAPGSQIPRPMVKGRAINDPASTFRPGRARLAGTFAERPGPLRWGSPSATSWPTGSSAGWDEPGGAGVGEPPGCGFSPLATSERAGRVAASPRRLVEGLAGTP